MPARTFVEWQAYCSIEPFGSPAQFWQAALVASMIANVHRKKNQQPFKPEDFMPKSLQHEKQRMDAEQQAQILKQNFENYQAAQKVTGQ